MSNYDKLMYWYGDRFQDLYQRNMAFKDDCKIVFAELGAEMMMNPLHHNDCSLDYHPSLDSTLALRHMMSRPYSYPSGRLLNGQWSLPSSGTVSPIATRSMDNLDLLSTLRTPRLLDAPGSNYLPYTGGRVRSYHYS